METLSTSPSWVKDAGREVEEDLAQGSSKYRSEKQNAALSPKTTCQSTSALTLLNEAETLHFTYNSLNNRVVLSAVRKHGRKSRTAQSQPAISHFTPKTQYLFLEQRKLL